MSICDRNNTKMTTKASRKTNKRCNIFLKPTQVLINEKGSIIIKEECNIDQEEITVTANEFHSYIKKENITNENYNNEAQTISEEIITNTNNVDNKNKTNAIDSNSDKRILPEMGAPEIINMKETIQSKLKVPKGLVLIGKYGKTLTIKPKNPHILTNSDKFLSLSKKFIHDEQPVTSSDTMKTELVDSDKSLEKSLTKSEKQVETQNVENNKHVKRLKVALYTDNSVQTEIKITSEKSVQTDKYNDFFFDMDDDIPNVTELVEYLIGNPKYSNDMDETKKNTLLDMSKNISFKSKSVSNDSASSSLNDLKTQLFRDLRDCTKYDCTGNMLIHNAILENNLKLMKRQIYVLKIRNVSVNVPNSNGTVPIQMAIINNSNISIVESLLQDGASLTVKDFDGNSLLHLCIMYSTPTVLEIIFKYSKNINIIDTTNDEGITPLMLTAIEKKKEFAEIILKNGADPNIRDEKSGRTALFHAVENDCSDIIKLLLRYKADPKLNNYVGVNPIEAARDLYVNKMCPLNESNDSLQTVNNGPRKRTKKQNKPDELTHKKIKMGFVSTLRKIK